MEINLKTDQFGRTIISDMQLSELFYIMPDLVLSNIQITDPQKYNAAVASEYLDWTKLEKLEDISVSVDEYHKQNQQTWFMPEEYANMDIAKYVLDQCSDQNELQRAGQELLIYAERDLFPLLQYLKYLVDTMRANNIVWGVGRGSSVASFVLYLLGIHRIHSLRHNLDFGEFMR